ncbi:MAG: DEAD/DEAH box helicase [Thaumarchaeota archaeon]|nr:DEAD/DEAH box helicase [Nitrososphaerota archaeon]
MQIFHAGELDGLLTVWGETSGENADSAKRPVLRKKGYPPTHPFATSFYDIYDAMDPYAPSFSATDYLECQVAVWLPTKNGRPIPSSDMIDELPSSGTSAKLAPWTVQACQLRGRDASYLVQRTSGRRVLKRGAAIGNSLAYWLDALRLAYSMIATEQFLPNVFEKNGSYHATWTPVFTGRYAEVLSVLAESMPAVCRAITWPEVKTAPKVHPLYKLTPIVAEFVDGITRTAIQYNMTRPYMSKRIDSAHDAWFHALISDDGKIDADVEDASKLSEHVREWRQPFEVYSDSSFRLCFKLIEPEENARKRGASDEWKVQYFVHPRSDPSLMIPTEDLLKNKTKIPSRNSYGSREFLLVALGQASELASIIATGLKTGSMSGFTTDTAGAYQFLQEASTLEQSGYGIILPSWWAGKTNSKIRIRANIKKSGMRASGNFSLDTVLQFDWQVALGDQDVTLKELERLAKMKIPLVKSRGQWVVADGEAIQSAIKLLKKASKKMTMREAVMMKLREGPATDDVPEVRVTSSVDAVAEVLEKLDGKNTLDKLKQPSGFVGKLRPYQVRGYSWLAFLQKWGLGGCLADDMGLGKTIQMLALLQQYVESGGSKPVLLVCPMSLIENWRKETVKFAPELSVLIHHGIKRKTGAAFKKDAKKHALVMSSYGTVQRDISLLNKVEWGGVVLDEAQNIKNYDTKQSRAVRTVDTGFRFAMTGTPVENNVGDLWSIMDFLNPGFLGTQKEFKDDFFVPIQMWHDPEAAERLKNATGPFVLRRLKTDKSIISDLPDKMEMKVYCQLTKEQASLYASVLKEMDNMLKSADGIKRKGIILAVLTKLKQVCNHPAQFLKDNSEIGTRSGKMARLTDMLVEAIDAGDRILVFTQFAEMGHLIQKHIQETFGLEVPFLHGGVSRTRRAKMVESFQAAKKDGPRVFILSLKAGGTGLNLTAANRVIHFDRWWNPAVEDQATDRAFRIGQKRNVQVHKFVCSGTLEERIDEMIMQKKQVSENVVGTGEGWLTELSNDDLRDVLALRKDAAVM